jgi:hypothetical protein
MYLYNLASENIDREHEAAAEIFSATRSVSQSLWTSNGGPKKLRRSVALPLLADRSHFWRLTRSLLVLFAWLSHLAFLTNLQELL